MLTVYNLEQSEQWDSIVRTFKEHDVYYLSGYVKAFYLHGDGIPLLFYYESDGLRGINVVLKRDVSDCECFKGKIPQGRYFDFSTAYGYGGWILDGEGDKAVLFSEYDKWCQKKGIISEVVRFHPILNNYEYCKGSYEIAPLGETVSIDLSSPEVIWSNFTSQNRNKIRKAKKRGVRIYSGRSEELFAEFKKVYNTTMNKDNATDYYYFDDEFYNSILYDLPSNAQIFYAQLTDGTIIGMAIMLTENGYMTYHLSGSLPEYSTYASINLLLYEAALWGSANGCKSLHLGGGVGSKEDSLLVFKKSFYRGEYCRYRLGKKIMNQNRYDELCKLAYGENPIMTDFFPAYRGGGVFCNTIYATFEKAA